MNQIANIIAGPHLLFTGVNGSKTYGVTVQSTLSPDESRARGLRQTWNINHYTIARADLSTLGLIDSEASALRTKFKSLKGTS
ncbi:hypothetical protein LCGC14_1562520 [marine sediment metagenome]|uniref:Uncharacterized protein n=1 Tax=marine sediment metagenome TaxID=412755 RepID=A0A0F9IM26_9ZZZZ